MLAAPRGAPIPGLDAVADFGLPIALLWYWWTFFCDARRGGGAKAGTSRETPESGYQGVTGHGDDTRGQQQGRRARELRPLERRDRKPF
jgi:hypothetical protein